MTSGAPLRRTSSRTRPDAASMPNKMPASQAHNSRPAAASSSRPCGPSAGTLYSFDILVGSRASIATICAGDAILMKKCFECRVVDRPTGATGYFDFGDSFSALNVDDRCCIRIRDCRITDVGNDEKAATRVECDAIRLDADADLESVSLPARRKH